MNKPRHQAAPRISALAWWAAAPLALALSGVAAQDLEPRSYANTPVGINFIVLGYSRMWGGISADPSLPLTDARIGVSVPFAAFARSLDVFGKSGKFDVILPTAWLSGTATVNGEPRERIVSGFVDPRFRFSVNFYGAPAMSLDEFKHYEQDVIIGASLQVQAPGGEYDPTKLINLGTHRWSVKTELGLSKRWGDLTVELAGEGVYYTDNNEFPVFNPQNGAFVGHVTRSQDPLYGVQGHLIYAFPYNIWGAIDATWYGGGASHFNDGPARSRLENTRIGATLALPISRRHSIKVYGSSGVSARIGGNFDQVGIAWQYRFGGGL